MGGIGRQKWLAVALVLALSTAGCGKPGLNSRQRDEVVDLASESAAAVVYDSDRIDLLEAELSDLQERVEDLELEIDGVRSDVSDVEGRLDYAGIY